MMVCCAHLHRKKNGKDRQDNQRYKCLLCGKRFVEPKAKPLGVMRVPVDEAKRALHMLVEGNSIRSVVRLTGLHKKTVLKLLVYFGDACRRFLDQRMTGLTLDHLEFDEQWTFVLKKQSRLTLEQRERCHDIGDIYLWTCIDQNTKLMPSFRVGKRTADNARRFMMDVADRLVWPNPHASDDHAFVPGEFQRVIQISTDGFAAYPEAVDLAFGQYARYGT